MAPTHSAAEDDPRLEALKRWLADTLARAPVSVEPASEDASFRRYFRVTTETGQWIAMDAPPEKEDSHAFVAVDAALEAAGLHVPHIHARDLDQGFLLLDDLGETLYLDRLDETTAEALYGDALAALLTMQTEVRAPDIPPFDKRRLREEMLLFTDWFLGRHLGIELAPADQATLETTFEILEYNAVNQPQVFVHRDYHSRNLMVTAANNPGIIDFQDAVIGPVTYDLASVLRDCYIAWPEERVAGWVADYYQRLQATELLGRTPLRTFHYWFDLMGLQRHLKAIGIFARLNHRDGKPGFLADIPRVLDYVETVSERYMELADFRDLLGRLALRERLAA